MSIVTFWNDDREQSGKTLTSVAVATRMAIDRNFKILLISTSFGDPTMRNCFFGNDVQKNLKIFGGRNNNIAVENGIEGLVKLIASKKLTPDVITDYTRVVFKSRLEVVCGFVGANDKTREENFSIYQRMQESYIDLIRTANMYYDMVIVDLDKDLSTKVKEEILRMSNLNILVFQQKLSSINNYIELRNINKEIAGLKYIPVIGRYDNRTKYNIKNITKYINEKKELYIIPFNLLYYEAAEEAAVVDLFLKMRNFKDKSDENYIFMDSTKKLSDKIIKRLQELQKKMR